MVRSCYLAMILILSCAKFLKPTKIGILRKCHQFTTKLVATLLYRLQQTVNR